MTRARYIASFIGQEPGLATFAGLYAIGDHVALDYAGYHSFPGNPELMRLGMTGRSADTPDCLAFEMTPLEHWQEWVGHLRVSWPKPNQAWWRWAGRGAFGVHAIDEESRFVRAMPQWRDLVLTWAELQNLPASWKGALAQWRGVYFIHDVKRDAGYVGSACGADNIHGRWCSYARSGHGGNRELRASNPADLRFSVLERTSPDLPAEEVIALEASWKRRLHTREAGLNLN